MNIETNKARESNMAYIWFIGSYTEAQAKRACDIQDLSFDNVEREYGVLYEQEQKDCASDRLMSNILNIEARYSHE